MIEAPEAEILKLTATQMAAGIRNREFSSRELVDSHLQRIESTATDLNALVVPLFDQARRQAIAADQALAQGQDIVDKPLWGVPVTIKELFDVQGTVTTAGVVADHLAAKRDAVAVASLRAAGAIVLGKTNVPQLGIAVESANPVYGQTHNPRDLERTAGGSSGGEAAIVAGFGSPLGLGSDGGGSIRMPAHFCGICGLKPTSHRLSMKGHWLLPSFPAGWAVPGPLARSVEDCQLALRCLMQGRSESDPFVPSEPCREMQEVDVTNLRIGFYDADDFVAPSPAVRRGVQEAKQHLSSLGATLVPFPSPPMRDAWKIQMQLFYADGGRWMRRLLGKSPVDARLKKTLLTASLPTVARRLLPSFLPWIGQDTLAELLKLSPQRQLSAYDFQRAMMDQLAFRYRFVRRWKEERLDALICPPFPSVAPQHRSADIVIGFGYTFVFNLLGLPAGVVPITNVRAGEESDRAPKKDDFVQALLRAEQGSAGLPVGVQVVAPHWREDIVLAVMNELSQVSS